MKTPKDILLEQHADATSALDRIRGQVVGELARPARPASASFLSQAFTHLLWQPRRIWCSLATVWVVMLFISASITTPETYGARQPGPGNSILERRHNVLRVELGLPPTQRAEKNGRPIRQSQNDQQSYA